MRKIVAVLLLVAGTAYADGIVDASPRVPLTLPTDKTPCTESDPSMCVDRAFFTPWQQKIEDLETTIRRIRNIGFTTTGTDSWLAGEKSTPISGASACLQWTGTAYTNLAVATDARVAALEAAVAALQGGTSGGTATCTGVAPSSGPIGTLVQLTGTNLSATSSVSFNTTSATFSSVSSTRVDATVPAGTNSGPVTITASGSTLTCGTFTVTGGTPPPTLPSGSPLFGSAHSPHNLPISYWEQSIKDYFDVTSVVDPEGTTELQDCLQNVGGLCPNWIGEPAGGETGGYVVFGEVAYSIYYARDGDPEYPVHNADGAVAGAANGTCNLDVGQPWAGKVRVPMNAMRWDSNNSRPTTLNPGATGTTDIHFTIIDEGRNRMYGFYSYGGDSIGIYGGKMISSTATCDLLHGTDATIESFLTPSIRYNCPGGIGYGTPFPAGALDGPGCGLDGIGAGVSAGGIGNTDSNGYIGGNGVIMPQDFDDTGWTGAAVGTFHHALRYGMPSSAQYGYMWSTQGPVAGSGSYIRNGQIMRLDPAYDCVANTGGASPTDWQRAQRRFCKTLQVYGAVQSDYQSYGPAFFALLDAPGAGPERPSTSPWSAEGMSLSPAAEAEAVAFASGKGSNGTKYGILPTTAWDELEMILPHGASYPPRATAGSGGGGGSGTGTLGDTRVGVNANSNMPHANQILVVPIVPTVNGTVEKISWYNDTSTPATVDMKALLYSNAGGEPDTRLATLEVLDATPGGWVDFVFTGTKPTLTAGTTYWIGIVTNAEAYTADSYYGNLNAMRRSSATAGYYTTPPADLTGLTTAYEAQLSLYLTYSTP